MSRKLPENDQNCRVEILFENYFFKLMKFFRNCKFIQLYGDSLGVGCHSEQKPCQRAGWRCLILLYIDTHGANTKRVSPRVCLHVTTTGLGNSTLLTSSRSHSSARPSCSRVGRLCLGVLVYVMPLCLAKRGGVSIRKRPHESAAFFS